MSKTATQPTHIRTTAFAARIAVPFHMPPAQDNGLPVPVHIHADLIRFLSRYDDNGNQVLWGRDFLDGVVVYRWNVLDGDLDAREAEVRNRLLASGCHEFTNFRDPALIDPVFEAGQAVTGTTDILKPHYRLAGIDTGDLFAPGKGQIEE